MPSLDEPRSDTSQGVTVKLQARVAGAILIGDALLSLMQRPLRYETAYFRGQAIATVATLAVGVALFIVGRSLRFIPIGLSALLALTSWFYLGPIGSLRNLPLMLRSTLLLGAMVGLLTGAASRKRLMLASVLGVGYLLLNRVLPLVK